MALTPSLAVLVASGAAVLALAAALLAIAPANRANRAFALFLVPFGLFVILINLRSAAEDPAQTDLLRRLVPYFLMAWALALLHFVLVYPTPRRWLPRGLPSSALLVVAVGALWVLYALDHTLWSEQTPAPPRAAGPLGAIMFAVVLPVVYALPVLLVRDYLRMPPGRRRTSVLLMSLGTALFNVHAVTSGVARGLLGFDPTLGATLVFDGAAETLFQAGRVVPLTALFTYVGWHAARAPERAVRHRLRQYLLLAALSAGSALVYAAGYVPSSLALWILALPALVSYAVLRHQLFDLDVKVKWTVKQSTVAAAFVGVFFVASEGAASFFAESAGSQYLGIAAAGLLVFALAPLQRAAEKIADAAVPGARPVGDLGMDERRALFRELAASAWADGTLSRDERELLGRLRDRLGLSAEEAERLEREAARGAA